MIPYSLILNCLQAHLIEIVTQKALFRLAKVHIKPLLTLPYRTIPIIGSQIPCAYPRLINFFII